VLVDVKIGPTVPFRFAPIAAVPTLALVDWLDDSNTELNTSVRSEHDKASADRKQKSAYHCVFEPRILPVLIMWMATPKASWVPTRVAIVAAAPTRW